MGDQDIRAALDRHWAASEAGDDDAEDEIYHDDAVLEYPQSRERILGRLAIRMTRGLLPNKHFTIRRVIGRGDLWVTEYVISYDGKPKIFADGGENAPRLRRFSCQVESARGPLT